MLAVNAYQILRQRQHVFFQLTIMMQSDQVHYNCQILKLPNCHHQILL